MIDELATAQLEENINDYLHGNFAASEQRILLTKWIGQAWEAVAANKDMVIIGDRIYQNPHIKNQCHQRNMNWLLNICT